jgi:hypothetical protein
MWMYRSLKIVLVGKQMMLPFPNAPKPRPVELSGPIAAHRPMVSHARRIATPAMSCRRVTAGDDSPHRRSATIPDLLRATFGSVISDPTVGADDRQSIVDLSYAYAAGIDHRDWALYRSIFTDVCEYDFSSWSGRAATAMPAEDWVSAVRSVNGNFDATQHLMSNHRLQRVDHETIVGVNELQAQHWFDAESMATFGRTTEAAWCLLGGHYTNRYVRTSAGWRIASCRLTVRWRTGDETIFALARQRAR